MAESRFDREFVRAALALGARSEVNRLLIVSDHPLLPSEIRGRPIKRKLVYAVTNEALAAQLTSKKYQTVVIPPYDYSRVEKIKVALVACQSESLVAEGDTILALAGHGPERNLDTLVRIRLGDEVDEPIRDAIKTFAVLDGAFIIREDGVVLSAGRYLQVVSSQVKLPMGLGARHSAAAAATTETKAVAITVSQTTGTVRFFKGGEIALELHQTARRI